MRDAPTLDIALAALLVIASVMLAWAIASGVLWTVVGIARYQRYRRVRRDLRALESEYRHNAAVVRAAGASVDAATRARSPVHGLHVVREADRTRLGARSRGPHIH